MTKAPRLTGKQVITALQKAGFEVLRIKGSHHFVQHPDGRCTVVSVHSGEIIGIGLFTKILHDTELTIQQFRKLL